MTVSTLMIAGFAMGCAPKTDSSAETKTAAQDNMSSANTAAESQATKDNSGTEQKQGTVADAAKGSNVLVAYFSATGNTRAVATTIADAVGGTLFEIVPESKYTDADLDWHNKESRSSVEMKDPQSRPTIVNGNVENLQNYSVVFIGYPIWWNEAPRVVSTFLDANNMEGKVIMPFCTAGSSSIDNSVKVLIENHLGKSIVHDGRKFNASSITREDVTAWYKTIEQQ